LGRSGSPGGHRPRMPARIRARRAQLLADPGDPSTSGRRSRSTRF